MATRVAGSKHYFKSGGSAYFYTWVEYEITSQTESGTYYKWRRGVYSYGDWAGSTLQFDDWCKGKSLTSGSSGSEVATTSWTTGAYLAYGSSRKFSWAAGYYGSSSTHEATLSTTWKPSTPVWTPNAPSGLSHARVSDAKNALSWTNNPTTTRPYSSIKVERSVDGGSWSQIASLSGTATSYGDASTSANHSYRYRLRACNSAGNSSYTSATAATYNTPAAPSSVSAAVKSGTEVTVTVANPANTATSLELQKSADGSEWSDVATVAGSPVESLDADLGGGEFWLRARNLRGSLASAWTASAEKTVTECAPAAPVLSSPAQSAVFPATDGSFALAWMHNPIDGSAQTAAQVRYSADGGETWEELQVDGASQSAALDNSFAANSSVTWGVRTKGAHADYGPWSASRTFHVRSVPQVAFEEPADGFVVETMPLSVRLSYADDAWTLASATLQILDADGNQVLSKGMGTSTECEVGADEWLPENGAEYSLAVSARSTSTLTASAGRDVSVDLVEPVPAALNVEFDPSDGSASISVSLGDAEEGMAEVERIDVYRVAGGNRVLIAGGVADGGAISDLYAPINEEFAYEVVSWSNVGTFSATEFRQTFGSESIYYVFAPDVAVLAWGARDEWEYDHPDAEEVAYWGAPYPTRYDTGRIGLSGTDEGHLMSTGDWRAFERLAASGGLCVRKSQRGDVFWAGVECSMEDCRGGTPYMGKCKVKWTRVAGDEL